MTMITIATLIALAAGCVLGTGVTIAWEWDRLRKVHRRYRSQKWIPVSERLPSESGRYLVAYPLFTRGNNWLNIMHFGKPSMPNIEVKGKCWYMPDDEYGDVVYDDVLAWMPLPDPYIGEE